MVVDLVPLNPFKPMSSENIIVLATTTRAKTRRVVAKTKNVIYLFVNALSTTTKSMKH